MGNQCAFGLPSPGVARGQKHTLRRSRVRSDMSMAPHLRTTIARAGRSSSPSKLSRAFMAPKKDELSSKACSMRSLCCLLVCFMAIMIKDLSTEPTGPQIWREQCTSFKHPFLADEKLALFKISALESRRYPTILRIPASRRSILFIAIWNAA